MPLLPPFGWQGDRLGEVDGEHLKSGFENRCFARKGAPLDVCLKGSAGSFVRRRARKKECHQKLGAP